MVAKNANAIVGGLTRSVTKTSPRLHQPQEPFTEQEFSAPTATHVLRFSAGNSRRPPAPGLAGHLLESYCKLVPLLSFISSLDEAGCLLFTFKCLSY